MWVQEKIIKNFWPLVGRSQGVVFLTTLAPLSFWQQRIFSMSNLFLSSKNYANFNKIANFMFKMFSAKGWPETELSSQRSKRLEKIAKLVKNQSSCSRTVARMRILVLLINLDNANQYLSSKKNVWFQQKQRKHCHSLTFACISKGFFCFIAFFERYWYCWPPGQHHR